MSGQVSHLPTDTVYRPDQVIRLGQENLKRRREFEALSLPIYIKSIDPILTPAIAGDLISIIGRPGSGKTGLLNRWARRRAKAILDPSTKIPNAKNRVVVMVSLEQPIEELYAFHAAAESRIDTALMKRGALTPEQWDSLIRSDMGRLSLPMWFIGHSMDRRKRRPRLTVEAIYQGCKVIEDEGFDIDSLYIDYLQRIPSPGRQDNKVVAVSDNLDACKDLGLDLGCPVVVNVAARREVDEYKPQVPGMDDGQWTSNIEVASDYVFSTTRPINYVDLNGSFGKIKPVIVKEETMLIMLLKQKLGVMSKPFWVTMDMRYNLLEESFTSVVSFV